MASKRPFAIDDQDSEQQRRSGEHEFWTRHQEKCGLASEYKPLLDAVVRRVRALAEAQDLEAWDYEAKLHEAEEVLEGVTDALRANWTDAPDGRFWYGFADFRLIEHPECWSDASPISPGRLDAAIAQYLERPWLQVNRLDWYALNGFVSDQLLRLADEIKSGVAPGQINWAYVFSGGKYVSTIFWKLGLAVATFAAHWVLWPALAGLSYHLGYTGAAKWILAGFATVVVLRISLIPRRLVRRRAQKRQLAELEDKLKRLLRIHQACHANTLNPTLLRERIAEAERGETLVPPAVYSILDRAISRDPAVFTIGG